MDRFLYTYFSINRLYDRIQILLKDIIENFDESNIFNQNFINIINDIEYQIIKLVEFTHLLKNNDIYSEFEDLYKKIDKLKSDSLNLYCILLAFKSKIKILKNNELNQEIFIIDNIGEFDLNDLELVQRYFTPMLISKEFPIYLLLNEPDSDGIVCNIICSKNLVKKKFYDIFEGIINKI